MNYVGQRRFWQTILIAMLVPLALIAFWPIPVDTPVQGQLASALKFLHAHGMPPWLNYKFVEAAANVVLFIPLGIVAALAFAEKRWWHIGVFGLIVSACIELGQLLFLHNRYPSILDLVTNGVGAVIGALFAAAALKHVQARRLSADGV